MSYMKRIIGVAAALLLVSALVMGASEAGEFANAKMTLDTTAETPAVDGGVTAVKAPKSGETVTIQVFVAGAGGKKTFGFNLELDNTGNAFSDNFSVTGVDFAGTGLQVNATAPVLSALLITQPTIGTDNLIATLTLTAKKDVSDAVTVKFVTAKTTLADATAANDALDVSAAIITFIGGPKIAADKTAAVIPIGGDVQATVTVSNINVGDTIDWTVATTGTASVNVVGQTGMTFQTTATAVTDAIVLEASGSGSVTADVTAVVGGETLTVQIVFSEQVPVELAAFGGELVEDHVVLNWTTASQTNNTGWRVLRSTDGETYEAVSELISGAGTSDALLSYTFVDQSLPGAEMVLYVLEQVDLDGAIHRSNAIEVILGSRFVAPPSEFATSVYPNPFNPATTIRYDLPADAAVSIVIYDALGQEVRRLVTEQVPAGRYKIQWDARDNRGQNVGSCVYIAKIEAGTYSASQKMLLLK